jgi:ADP-ribose pyrophosphatase YjhB (NUDIX family)
VDTAFTESYIGKLRTLVGHTKLIVAGVRAVVQDKDKRILLIHRKDTKRWGMPSGSVELGESILDALKREVKEETGLDVETARPFALYTDPRYTVTYPNGDQAQQFTVVFVVDQWNGTLLQDNEESYTCRFFPLDALPDTHEIYLETIEDLKCYRGQFIVK